MDAAIAEEEQSWTLACSTLTDITGSPGPWEEEGFDGTSLQTNGGVYSQLGKAVELGFRGRNAPDVNSNSSYTQR